MELNSWFTPARWKLIEKITEKPLSPTELAQITKSSVANITYQLKILEAYGIVKGETLHTNKSGKPRTIYSLKNKSVYLLIMKEGFSASKILSLSGIRELIFTVFFFDEISKQYLVLKFFLDNYELFDKCDAVALIKDKSDADLDFLIITKKVDEIRGKYSNVHIKDEHDKDHKIACWTHSENELVEGLSKNEKYFLDILKNNFILYDPNQIINKIKGGKNN
ncbi:winged helix-turn-helix transcriptional regulator [Candidatus Woesearchaeota archaeon]|nr:winged helix-turn-helix transcriptional regulator [Candidatus Woesearchaeota archaeon]